LPRKKPTTRFSKRFRAKATLQAATALVFIKKPFTIPSDMFENIKARLETAAEKLAHLRRFL
jgi:hypothetical protein